MGEQESLTQRKDQRTERKTRESVRFRVVLYSSKTEDMKYYCSHSWAACQWCCTLCIVGHQYTVRKDTRYMPQEYQLLMSLASASLGKQRKDKRSFCTFQQSQCRLRRLLF